MAANGMTVDYQSEFDPEWYINTFYGSVLNEVSQSDQKTDNRLQFNLLQFNLEKYHEVFHSGIVKGGSLLDIGTGPSIHSIISACRHVDDVYLSDIAPQNRKVLTDWWKSDKLLIEKITEYVFGLEKSGQTVAEWQQTMKEKVRDVLSIDVTLVKPFGGGCDVTQFDIITSSLCLEAAAQTLDQYRSNAANVSSLLKSGGHLILNGVLGQSWYRVGEVKFACVSLTREDIESIFVSCGFEIQRFEIVKFKSKDNEYSNFQGYFFMYAVKR
ncbi:indolethylamine N-methyltransferase-like isoform X1 [Pecten maximus]|uniref:indolethylamine N-methyltransferase-like isoform X1 n=1 Tax=Pecten maximus TaxID=6579 RepID=UPI001458518F|nr:indolethylamine N-methyltransferase-like isoform X1 [Pecten maximus]XP_033728088.1 indolethylamine N-methyltransferase-like isoform X1 [Pecten maximus]XP_033728089.1 indolethylamine N-methyltransferase-like isoform X1 [Pecten maximus]XP_033728090.1 indolethylamine N-methyltransferase-like isoform X1 [Pecten maximus]